MGKVIWADEALKDLDALDAHIQGRIKEKVTWLRNNLSGLSQQPLRRTLWGFYKLRVGDYRIIYSIQGQIITIEAVGHRRDIYK